MAHPSHPPLILASQSPRRGQLLREAGFAITQQPPPFADPDQPDTAMPHSLPEAEQYAATLAMQKALSMVQVVATHALVISADTLCVSMSPGSEGTLIGKPTGRDDARAMIAGFMNRAHAVVTGVALLEVNGGREVASPMKTTLADTTLVMLGGVPDDELDRYLDTGDWQGKAGGYNLFDRQDAGWPITVEGDPTTVVGLPMEKLVPALARCGFGNSPVSQDIEKIIVAVRAEVPEVEFEQLKTTHPADDMGLWFVRRVSGDDEIQLESSDGQCPFLIESTDGDKRTTAHTIEQATKIIRELLNS